jgi:hypothetical protein
VGELPQKGAEASEGEIGATQAGQACSRVLAASKVHPLLQVEWLLLPLGEMFVQAMLGAKLLVSQAVANETEFATAASHRLRGARVVPPRSSSALPQCLKPSWRGGVCVNTIRD